MLIPQSYTSDIYYSDLTLSIRQTWIFLGLQIPRKRWTALAQTVSGRWRRLDSLPIWKSAWVSVRYIVSQLVFTQTSCWIFDTGIGRNSSRIASRRIASSRDGNNYFASVLSDDEDDADWSGDRKKKKIQPVRTNGSKKNGKSA